MSDIEQRLIEAARNGEWLECAEPDNVVRADVIRELLLGHHGELDPRGVQLRDAQIAGRLDLERIRATVGLILDDCTVRETINARYAHLPDLLIYGGRSAGIDADGLEIGGDLFLRAGTCIASDDEAGAIRLVGAHIAGDLDLVGAEITNNAGAALNAAGINVNGSVFLRNGVRISGSGEDGAVRLIGAHISGHIEWTSTEIINVTGTALNMSGIQVDGNIFMREGVRVTGHSKLDAAINLVGGSIGKDLEFTDAEVSNPEGSAVDADRVHVAGSLFLIGRTRLFGGGDDPLVRLTGAHVNGKFNSGPEVFLDIKDRSNPTLDLRGTTVATSVTLPTTLVCPSRGRSRKCANERWARLDDFSYASLGPGWDWQQWLHLVRTHTPAYHASAYQRLAAVERAAGHDGTVRRILIDQQTDLRRRSPQSLGGVVTRRFHWMWGVLAGYGYRARRTAAALLLVLTIAGGLGWWAGQVPTRPGHLTAERVTTGLPCSTVELIGLGLDRGLPLAMTGMRARCDLDTASRKGQAFTAAIWLVQLAVWGLATLALAGYTNLVRKPG